MKSLKSPILLAVGALSLASIAAGPVLAGGPSAKYAGMAASSVAGCPDIAWRLAKDDSGTLRGMVWYDDMSGLSRATGTAANGKFHVTLTSVSGHGPVGTVQGARATDGSGEAKMTGAGCANMTVKMQPIQEWGGTG